MKGQIILEVVGLVFGIIGFGIGVTGLSFGIITFSRLNALENKLKESGVIDKDFNSEKKV